MKNAQITGAVIVLTLVSALFSGIPEARAKSTLAGRVVDADGHPLDGASVRVARSLRRPTHMDGSTSPRFRPVL